MEDFSKLTKQELIDRLNKQDNSSSETEMDKLNRLATSQNLNAIPITVKNDHKNMFLYTALNKRIGPLHPENAKRTMDHWKQKGIQLYVKERTAEQIEQFKLTDEYKSFITKYEAERKLRHDMSRKGSFENLAKEIARETATAVAAVK